ncbi:MAG: Gfo/Idh/MocA family oxidoreductase, partial [Acidobacteria bacterium]|nr:Gfo/Idh/MocA family oxidoreductase [Acidobacteriota bacterium]
MNKKIERRSFIKSSIATAGAIAASSARETPGAPMIASGGAVQGANDQIRIGLIGCGGQGNWDASDFAKQPNVRIAALCDVYEGSVKETFGNKALNLDPAKTPAFKDFRRVLDDRNIDAVIIATPDHWHALPAIMACQAGKDVYIEKPLSLTIEEGRR